MSIYTQGFGGGMNPSITVTTTVGATVIVTLGTKSVAATATDGTAKIGVWDYGSYSVHAALGDAVGDATVDVVAVQDYAVTVETAVPIPTVLNNATWATIKEVAEKSQGPNYWSVGDTKQITINGKLSDGLTLSNYQTWVYIIGFDHNKDVEGTGIAFGGFKTAQASGTDVALCDSGYNSDKSSGQWFNMNNNNSTTGGWASCNMRNNTLPLVKATMPSDLQSVLKTTTIYTDNTGGFPSAASNVTATQDDLYLLAEFEIFGTRSYANTAEQNYQQQYAYYVAGNSKVKYRHSSTATTANWWERSVRESNSSDFCRVYFDGASASDYAHYSYGLSLAFKVGGAVTKPASTLPVGASVYAKESGVPVEYIVVHQGNPDTTRYDASCNGAWLLRKYCINAMQWNSATSNEYAQSSINSWLNSTFIDTLNIKDIISQVKIPYEYHSGNTLVAAIKENGLSTKAFLLSAPEVNYGEFYISSNIGNTLEYFSSCSTSSDCQTRIARQNASSLGSYWWLRSIQTNSTANVYSVNATGKGEATTVTNANFARPAFIIPSDTEVDEFGNIVV